MSQQAQRWCPDCERNVLATRAGVNHILHLLLCVFTCWLWAGVWLLLSVTNIGGWLCPRCGSRCGRPLSIGAAVGILCVLCVAVCGGFLGFATMLNGHPRVAVPAAPAQAANLAADNPQPGIAPFPARSGLAIYRPQGRAIDNIPRIRVDGDLADTSSDEWIGFDDVRVACAGIEIDWVDLVVNGRTQRQQGLRLWIPLIIGVEGPGSRQVIGWGIERCGATLTDDKQMTSPQVVFPRTAHTKPKQLESGIATEKTPLFDFVIFELPFDGAEDLILSLPASNVGGNGTMRFKIPRDSWRRFASIDAERAYPTWVSKSSRPTHRTEPSPPVATESAKPVATEPAKPKGPPPSKQDEDFAASELELAKTLRKNGLPDLAKGRLSRIVKDYPDTKAAVEARELLAALGQ